MHEQTITNRARAEIEDLATFVSTQEKAQPLERVCAAFLHTLVLAGGYRRGIEIGTSFGYSGLWIGAALQHNGGALVTVEREAGRAARARESFARAGLNAVTVVQATAIDALPGIDGPFDFAFLDSDVTDLKQHFELLWGKLSHRATIVTHGVASDDGPVAAFLEHLRGHPQLCSTLLPLGAGLEVAVKLEPYAPTATIDGADWVI